MRSLYVLALAALCTFTAAGAPRAAAPAAGSRWAVVVGVARHADRGLPVTPNAASDARRVYDWLTTVGGYASRRVLLLTSGGARFLDPDAPAEQLEPTRRNLRLALGSWLPRHVRPGDTVLLFFAGQGATNADRPVSRTDWWVAATLVLVLCSLTLATPQRTVPFCGVGDSHRIVMPSGSTADR